MRTKDGPTHFIDPIERSLTLGGTLVTVRQDRAVWDAFDAICARRGVSPESLCESLEGGPGGSGLADRIGDFVTGYFRDALDADAPPVWWASRDAKGR